MNIPEHLAYTLIKYLDMTYLSSYPQSGDKEDYLDSIQSKMENIFNISWSKGGTHGTCWDNDGPTEVSAQDEPPMYELEEFLNNNYPTLDSDDFDYILSSVDETEDSESDWYGGRTYEGKKSLHVEKLATLLVETFYKNSLDCDWINFYELIEKHSEIVIHINRDEYYKIKLNKDLNKNLSEENINNNRIKI